MRLRDEIGLNETSGGGMQRDKQDRMRARGTDGGPRTYLTQLRRRSSANQERADKTDGLQPCMKRVELASFPVAHLGRQAHTRTHARVAGEMRCSYSAK